VRGKRREGKDVKGSEGRRVKVEEGVKRRVGR
jgi:hypothetical protein